jgi:hypothetical protein
MYELTALLPIIIPIVVLQLGLAIAAVVSILRRRTFRVGSRGVWLPVVIVIGIIGPVLYFILGRGDE